MRELQRCGAPADDQQALKGLVRKAVRKEGLAGQVAGLIQALDVRHARAAAGGDDDGICADPLQPAVFQTDVQGMRVRKAALARVYRNALGLRNRLLQLLIDVNLPPHPRGDPGPVYGRPAERDPYKFAALGLPDQVRRIDQHFGGDAAAVEAGAAKGAFFNDRAGLAMLKRAFHNHQPAARAQYCDVKMLHANLLGSYRISSPFYPSNCLAQV